MPETTPQVEKVPTMNDMANMAQLYAVPMSEGALQAIAKDATPEKAKAFEEHVKTTAQGLYPSLAPQIAAGIPTAHLLDPYRQVAKQMLGESFEPDFIADPKSAAALAGRIDEKTGRPTLMSLDQWKQHIKSHPGFGWDTTPAAHEQIGQVIKALHESFTQPPKQGAMQ